MKLETELSLLSSVVAKRGEVDQHMQALLFMWAQKERETLVFPGSEERTFTAERYRQPDLRLGCNLKDIPFTIQMAQA